MYALKRAGVVIAILLAIAAWRGQWYELGVLAVVAGGILLAGAVVAVILWVEG
jgi:hypothetical protein